MVMRLLLHAQGWKATMCSPRPASGRTGMLLPVEGERWQLILTGHAPLLRMRLPHVSASMCLQARTVLPCSGTPMCPLDVSATVQR